MNIREAAVAGTWYPRIAGALARDVDAYLAATHEQPRSDVLAVIAPHAGLMFSGPVGAHAYKAASGGSYDVAVLVGPSHFVAFEGVALYPDGAFATPFGPAPIDQTGARAIAAFPIVRPLPAAHSREHSLEMQLPFLKRVLPEVPIVPLLMGHQSRETIEALAEALAAAFRGRRPLIVASTDLSHYFDAQTAASLDARVTSAVEHFDSRELLDLFEEYPEHERGRFVACGGGPAISVMMAARALGAATSQVLKYAHSGEVSGDYAGVVGYLAAAFLGGEIGQEAGEGNEGTEEFKHGGTKARSQTSLSSVSPCLRVSVPPCLNSSVPSVHSGTDTCTRSSRPIRSARSSHSRCRRFMRR